MLLKMRCPRLSGAITAVWLILFLAGPAGAKQRFTGPWNLDALKRTPDAEWGARSNLVQEVRYDGEPFHGKPTRLFAYLGRPEGKGPFPAMVLVHGGGGKAFSAWAEHWARRGYMALAMDLSGNGPAGPLPDGGPDQSDASKFRDFTDADARDMWTYHAVAAVIRGHSLLAAQPETDRRRVGITGISWGGYLTCIVAGLDDRLKVAVPVYGCGFLDENSVWVGTSFTGMTMERRNRWVNHFDPSKYLPGVGCPILFLNGSNDFAYPMDSYKKSYSLVHGPRTISVQPGLPHGHIWTFGEVDAFVDHLLRGSPPLAKISPLTQRKESASATFQAVVPVLKAEFHFTTDDGPWQKRLWKTEPARIEGHRVRAPIPPERPLVCFFTVTDARGLTVSTAHEAVSGK
jgi:dienelactone hydrolase